MSTGDRRVGVVHRWPAIAVVRGDPPATLVAMATPLFITADEALREELLRLAAAAGVTPEVAADAGSGLVSWAAAPLVLVGLDQAEALARLVPGRRPGVHVVTWSGAPPDAFRLALHLGACDVADLPTAEPWLVQELTDLGDPARARGLTLGVIGGSGGAGATTFACAMGQVAAESAPALLVDTDPAGPGLDRVAGLETVGGVRWDALHQTVGRLSARSLREAVPARNGLGVLTWRAPHPTPLDPAAVREVLSAAQRGFDTVVIDLPRSGDGLTEELVSRCDQLVVISTATVLGVASTMRLCARFPAASQRLVVRGSGIPAEEIAAVTGVATVMSMAAQRRLDESVDLGLGPVRLRRGPLHRAASALLGSAVRVGPVT